MLRPPSGWLLEIARAACLGGLVASPIALAQDDDILVPDDAAVDEPATPEPPPPAPSRRLDAAAVERLTLMLAQHSSFKVRATAAVALGRLGDPRGTPALESALTTDPHYAVRAAAASALGKVKAPGSVRGLLRALNDTDPMVRTQAKDALGAFHSKEHLPHFEAAATAEDPRHRRSAVMAYGDVLRAGDDTAAGVLLTALGDDDEEVREIAARALTSLGHERSLPLLLRGLTYVNAPVRATSARMLAESADERAVPALLEAVRRTEETEEVRSSLRAAVRAHREYLEVGAVLSRAGDKSLGAAQERLDALSLAGAFGGGAAERVLMAALDDEDVLVRATAARATVDLGRERARALLSPAIARERDPRVKRQMEVVLRTLR